MKVVILAGAILLVILIVGYMAITSSSYTEISDLTKFSRPTVVTVRGFVTDTKLLPERDLVVFVLEDENGNVVYATYILSKFISQYGAPPSHSTVEQEVVMKGTFYPGKQGKVLGRLEIQEILQGCHKAYEAPPATGG